MRVLPGPSASKPLIVAPEAIDRPKSGFTGMARLFAVGGADLRQHVGFSVFVKTSVNAFNYVQRES